VRINHRFTPRISPDNTVRVENVAHHEDHHHRKIGGVETVLDILGHSRSSVRMLLFLTFCAQHRDYIGRIGGVEHGGERE